MYLKTKFLVIMLLLGVLAGFNYVVDPYGVYHPADSFQFSEKKTQFFMKEPAIKPYRVSDLQPNFVILGSSRAGFGFDEGHPYFSDKSVYNFSMAGASMYVTYRAFQHAVAVSVLDEALLDLSFIAFNDAHAFVTRNDSNPGSVAFESLLYVEQDGKRNRLAPFRQITQIPQYLLSLQVTQDSLATLQKQGVAGGWYLSEKGGWRGSTLADGQSQGKRFRSIVNLLATGYFKDPLTKRPFSIYRDGGELSRAYGYYERLLVEAHRNDVALTLAFSPSHAYFYEAIEYHGLARMYQEWKQSIVAINEKVAEDLGELPFPVWDFAYYSDINTEIVPQVADTVSRMRWHYDPIHFKPAAGDQVLDQIYLSEQGAGVLLNAQSMKAMSAMQLEKQREYRLANTETVTQLTKFFRKAEAIAARRN